MCQCRITLVPDMRAALTPGRVFAMIDKGNKVLLQTQNEACPAFVMIFLWAGQFEFFRCVFTSAVQ